MHHNGKCAADSVTIALFASSVLTGMSGVYEHLAAVEDSGGTGGVMKSTDEGLTWNYIRPATGFPAWVSGAKAKKIAIGAPETSSAGKLYYQSETHDAIARAPLDADGWVSRRDAGSTYGSYDSFCKLRAHAGSLFRLAIIGTCEGCTNAVGQMQRSDDGGVTWTDIGPGAIQDSGGEWWGVKAYDFASDGKMYVIAIVSRSLRTLR